MTEGEWKAIEKIAAGIGMGIGEYLRISALGKTIYQIEGLKPVLHELNCISRNLNQLTMLSHQGVVRTVNLTATADGTVGAMRQSTGCNFVSSNPDNLRRDQMCL